MTRPNDLAAHWGLAEGEAERCGRLALLWRGKLEAVGTPREIVEQLQAPSLEDAFIALQLRDERAA